MTKRKLWAIRHAPTQGDGVCVGASDVPTQIAPDAVAARMLEHMPGGTFTAVWCA